MKKVLSVAMEERKPIEFMRILLGEDVDGALAFLKQHCKGKARELLESG